MSAVQFWKGFKTLLSKQSWVKIKNCSLHIWQLWHFIVPLIISYRFCKQYQLEKPPTISKYDYFYNPCHITFFYIKMRVYSVMHSKSHFHRAVEDVMETDVMQCRVTREKERKVESSDRPRLDRGVIFLLVKLHLHELIEETVYCPFRCLLQRHCMAKGRHHKEVRILDLRFNIRIAVRKWQKWHADFYWDIHYVLYLCSQQILHNYLWVLELFKNNHQPEIEGCGLAEVERAHRQTSHGYRHGVMTWKKERQTSSTQFLSKQWHIYYLTAPLSPFMSGIDPFHTLSFNPSPSMDELPELIVDTYVASSGISRGCMVHCNAFFSQLWFLVSIS